MKIPDICEEYGRSEGCLQGARGFGAGSKDYRAKSAAENSTIAFGRSRFSGSGHKSARGSLAPPALGPPRLTERNYAENRNFVTLRYRVCLSISMLFVCTGVLRSAEREFRFERPDAQTVELMAEFNNWKAVPMKKQSDGTWAVTASASPGTYGYKFLVNGTEWVFDPKNPQRKNVNGIENSAIEIRSESSSSSAAATAGRSLGENVAGKPGRSVGEVVSFAGKPTASPTGASARDTTPTETALSPTAGEILTLEVPLSAKRRAEAAKEGNNQVAHARMAIVVPQNFDPQKSWPVLVVSNTEAYSNIDSLRQFKSAAADEGWVILAADAVEAEKNQEGGMRWPTIAAAFDYLTTAWPAVKDWPIACGGMSGGAKNSAFVAARLAHENHRMIGMLMMGCNQDMATVAFRRISPSGAFLGVPIFLSSGKSDTIASPAQHIAVKDSMRSTGFQKVRLENFDGAHDVYQPHVGQAPKWFAAESQKTGSGQRASSSSDFDKFFKKNP